MLMLQPQIVTSHSLPFFKSAQSELRSRSVGGRIDQNLQTPLAHAAVTKTP